MLGLFTRQKPSVALVGGAADAIDQTGLFEQFHDEHHHCLDLLQRVEISLQQRKLSRIPQQLLELDRALETHHQRELKLLLQLELLIQEQGEPQLLQRLRNQRRQRDANHRRIRLFIEFYRPKATDGQYVSQFSFALAEVGQRLVRQFEEEETDIFPLSRNAAH